MGILILKNYLVVTAILLYLACYPKERVWMIKMPFAYLCDLFRKKDKALKDQELLEILSLLENMMLQPNKDPLGADYIIDHLSGYAELTKSAFYKMLNLLRLGRRQDAGEVFTDEIGTPLAADIARILLQIDEVEPYVLKQVLKSVEQQIRETGKTHKKITNERYSDLILIPIVITAMLTFLNFLVVTFVAEFTNLTSFFNI